MFTFLAFALAVWLGLYLSGRAGAHRSVRLAGVALTLYGVAMALAGVGAPDGWRTALLLAAGLVWPGVARAARVPARENARGQWLLYAVSLLFLAMELFALLIPALPIPREWLYAALGFDLALLGWLILGWDAFEQGERVLPHAIRSLAAAAGGGLLLGGQVALVAGMGEGWTLPMRLLLYSVVGSVILAATLGEMWQGALDRLTFARLPRLSGARARLRAEADALPRVAPLQPLERMDEGEWTRQTRLALRAFGDVGQLAQNPLAALPSVTAQLRMEGWEESDLARGRALQLRLRGAIAQLKPEAGEFGTTPAWRHYNALYLLYVIGLKPYTVRLTIEEIDPAYREVWRWLREQVPERTLRHWQSAATRLVAGELAEEIAPAGGAEREIGTILHENR